MAKTSLGKAYVQILPSADGITNSITNVLKGESESAGKNSGNSVGSNLIGTLKKVIIGAGIGKVLMDSIKLGGENEQLVGGIETLFKDSAATISKYANEAYKSAGISANEYMAQATSFSASLISSLNGDTTKASEVTNMAIIDMADNANKMGTSLDLIQNAYQGFAKQNYTMLDNLKLGYGGTRTEMQRLLKDAQKFSGVKYDISNLNDVYEAIHVIQTEMGIAGATAEEAEKTLEGSFNTMKASFENLLTGLASGDSNIGTIMSRFVTSVVKWLKNLIPMVITIAKQIPKALVQGIQQSMADLGIGLDDIVLYINKFFSQNLPDIIDSGHNILSQFIDGIINNIPQLVSSAWTIIKSFVNALLQNMPLIMEKGFQLLGQLVQGIINNLPSMITGAIQAILWFAQAIVDNLPTIIAKGIEMITSLLSGILSEIPNMWESVKKGFADLDWISIGTNLVQGIIDGIKSMSGALWNAACSLASSAWDAITGFFDINSPSKKMRWAGQMLDEGLRLGLEDGADGITKEMKSIATDISKPINSNIQMSSRYQPSSSRGGGYNQTVIVNSPKELTPSEVARQTKLATRNMVLAMNGGI